MKLTNIVLKVIEQFSLFDTTEELDGLRKDLTAWHDSCTSESKGFDLLYFKFFKDNLAIRCLSPLIYFFLVNQIKILLSDDDEPKGDKSRFQ